MNRIKEQYSHLKEISIDQIDFEKFIEYYILSKDTVEIYDTLKIFAGDSTEDSTEDSKDHISSKIQSLKTNNDKIKSNINMFIKELMKVRDRNIFEKTEIENESLNRLTLFLPSSIL
jgi:predicted phosphodiesterase